MIAVIDESTPEDRGGVFYVVTAAIVIEMDAEDARTTLREVIARPGRTRPFHWHREGPATRDAMCTTIEQLGVVAHVVIGYPTARHGQERARAIALSHVVPGLVDDGVDQVLIERRGDPQDKRDKRVILDVLHARGPSCKLAYRWVPKEEPLVWIADALAGVVRDYLLGQDSAGRYLMLMASRCLAEPIYFKP